MFVLAKSLDVALSPLSWILAAMVAAMFVERARVRRALLGAAVAVLYVASTELAANALFRAVERPILTTERDEVTYDVVVVLGGLEDERVFDETGEHAYNDNVERLLVAYDLLRTGRARRALLAGGRSRSTPGPSEAELLVDKLAAWGVERDRLLVEPKSRDTWENAVLAKPILDDAKAERVLLVTSAFHMQRAAGAFRRAGIVCDTRAVDQRSYAPELTIAALLPRTRSLHMTSAALHEWFGRRIYALRGRS